MAKTLEEIKGMNIPVGAPIELNVDSPINDETFKKIGYFDRITEKNQLAFTYSLGERFPQGEVIHLDYINDIKILEYKK